MSIQHKTNYKHLSKVFALFLAVFLGSCAHYPTRDKNDSVQYLELETVVEAVQFAVEKAAADEAWAWSKEEKDHWKAACKLAEVESAKLCFAQNKQAENLCEARCQGGICSPVDENYCAALLDGSVGKAICIRNPKTEHREYCTSNVQCQESLNEKNRICAGYKSITLPSLKSATLNLKIEQTKKSGGEINLFFVVFGGGQSSSSSSTTTLVLEPRIRDTDYGAVIPNLDKRPLQISPEAKLLASDLASQIISAVRSASLEVTSDGESATPPMFLSEFKVDLALSVDQSGKFAVGKTWDALPVSVEAGMERKNTAVNTLSILYKR